VSQQSVGHTTDAKSLNQAVSEVLETKYRAWLNDRYFEVESSVEGPVVVVKVTLQNADKSYVYPIEGRMMFEDQDLKADAARSFLLDFIDSYVEEYLSGGEETYLPIDWATYDCEGLELQLRGQVLNTKLEALADHLLNDSAITH
jgi:hypothetical protein